MKIIAANLSDDIRSLKAFSTTCHSWLFAAAPRLHHTLVFNNLYEYTRSEVFEPLVKLHKMDSLPVVKTLWFQAMLSTNSWPSPITFNRQALRYFSALTNVQQLRIDRFGLSEFMPGVQQYFGHFAPTLRCISLWISSGTQRQVLSFLGLFPNLDDIEIGYDPLIQQPDTTTDPEVAVPFSTYSMRGRLNLAYFPSETISMEMITQFGGLRFRSMDLYEVEGSQLLLGACKDISVLPKRYGNHPYSHKFALTE